MEVNDAVADKDLWYSGLVTVITGFKTIFSSFVAVVLDCLHVNDGAALVIFVSNCDVV